MTISSRIPYYICSFFSTFIVIILISSIPTTTEIKASGLGAPIFGVNSDFVKENQDLSMLLSNVENGKSLINEYIELERNCQNLSIKEIIDKAYPYYIKRNDIETGMMLHRIAVGRYNDDFSDKDKLYCAIAYGNLGYYLIFEKNNPLDAYPYLAKGMEIAEHLSFPQKSAEQTKLVNAIAGITTNIAKVYAVYKDYGKASYYYRKAYETAQQDNNSIAIPYSFIDLIHFAWSIDSLHTLTKEIEQYKRTKLGNNSLQSMRDYAQLMAEASEKFIQKDFSQALSLVDSAISKYDIQVDDRRSAVFNRLIAGKIAFAEENQIKANDYFNTAESMIKEGRLDDMYDLLYQLRATFHSSLGNAQLSNYYQMERLRMRDSLNNLQSYSSIRDMELALQANDYTKRLSDSRSNEKKWIYSTILICILFVIICILITHILIKNRKLQKHSEDLFRKNIELLEMQKRQTPDIEAEIPTARDQEEDDLTMVYNQIIRYMSESEEIFKPTFSIEFMVSQIGVNLKQASKAINSVGGKNFNTLLGEYRVNKACEKLLEPSKDSSQRPTIEVIASEVGYKSRTHFLRVFKSVTGLTTSEFLQEIKKNENPC